MTIKLLLQLTFGIFSFDRKNMRWFNLKRVLVVIFVLPLFLTLFLINNVFLLLDYLLFPHFLMKKIEKPVFIISAPRSATTYLFHTLSKDNQFTCFKLWEIVFSPSILQKFIFLGLLRIDGWIGSPVKKSVLYLENKLIGNLKKIHLIGLNLPEEDEAILLWSLSSFYFNFFYPDSHFFDDLALFDKALSKRRKRRIMNSYKRYVQRHNFVFNRTGEKQFLSKNPIMMSKVAGVASVFPNALLININRSPGKTFPSTQELNRTLYALFTSKPVTKDIEDRTHKVLLEWYQMCESNMEKHFSGSYIKVDFGKLVSRDPKAMEELADFLDISIETILHQEESNNKQHKSSNNYQSLSDSELEEVLKEIPFLKPYC